MSKIVQKKVKFTNRDTKQSGCQTMGVLEKLSDLNNYKEDFPNNYPVVKKYLERELRGGSKIIVNSMGGWQTTVVGQVEIL